MKKETHMQILFKYSVFLLTIFSLISPVAASTNGVFSGQNTHPIFISTRDQQKPVAVVVKSQKVNLRGGPSKCGSVVRTVNKGDLLNLIDAKPIGPAILLKRLADWNAKTSDKNGHSTGGSRLAVRVDPGSDPWPKLAVVKRRSGCI